ncbi:RNA-directed DNA polymerase (Reverse transcriptase) [Trifolium medium]|uniref:RNA-directed DNA polymerase (Reverse transcriptase) n=1 Tax=Trifolium medium TaxID=97028 RepID=A0A392PLH4_9FABA|nr:RNA-directed DNA polymerase (Reverse transcriptase) [Trifolium medium]
MLGCVVGKVPFLYLWLPIGGDPCRLSFWDTVLTRIRTRLSGWKNRFLSFGGRLTLLKFVLTSLPVYALSFFKAPGREYGGLGVRQMQEFNTALLGKWQGGWQLGAGAVQCGGGRCHEFVTVRAGQGGLGTVLRGGSRTVSILFFGLTRG